MKKKLYTIIFIIMFVAVTAAQAKTHALEPGMTQGQQKLEDIERHQGTQEVTEDTELAEGDVPEEMFEDLTPRFLVSEIRIRGNSLISTNRLLSRIPDSFEPDGGVEPDSQMAYDLSGLRAVASSSATEEEVSARSIQGFTEYLLDIYQRKGYAGIYVFIPPEAFDPENGLEQGILPISIFEAPVESVEATYYDVENQPAEKGKLRKEAVKSWSPVEPGKVANRREMDEYLELLNLNPDRYVSAIVSQGVDDPNSLAVEYRVYEAQPWHYFIQIDNSGTKDVRWTPRFGLINTNLLGYDDKLTVVYQATPDSTWNDEYAIYGSYDFPIAGPRLRLNIFGGYNEFGISGGDGISFLGRGSFAGATVRYNLFQSNKWIFDLTGTISQERSKTTPSIFPEFLTSDLRLALWGYGAEMYRSADMADTRISFNAMHTLNGSDKSEFGLARTNAERDIVFYNTQARHSQFLDSDRVSRISASLQWIKAEDRLPPSRMTSFGGMYTVRGYDEYEIVADGGIIASLQYEYDIITRRRVREFQQREENRSTSESLIRKLAPVVFVDYGQARIKNALPTENRKQELASLGCGLITEIGNNFLGTVYYGYPLIETNSTNKGKGRVNVGLLLRW